MSAGSTARAGRTAVRDAVFRPSHLGAVLGRGSHASAGVLRRAVCLAVDRSAGDARSSTPRVAAAAVRESAAHGVRRGVARASASCCCWPAATTSRRATCRPPSRASRGSTVLPSGSYRWTSSAGWRGGSRASCRRGRRRRRRRASSSRATPAAAATRKSR